MIRKGGRYEARKGKAPKRVEWTRPAPPRGAPEPAGTGAGEAAAEAGPGKPDGNESEG